MVNKKTGLVLDCSLTMAWCFEDEISAYAEKVLDSLIELTAWVPALWSIEVANALTVACRRKRLSRVKAIAFRESLNGLSIEVDNYFINKPIEIVFDVAMDTGLTTYDATYLELAIRKNLPIATLDKDLRIAAKKAGISLALPEISD